MTGMLQDLQKQPPEVAFKERCSKKTHKISRKTHVLESLFNKVAGVRPAILLKKRLWHRCFPVNFTKFLRTYFTEHHWATASRLKQCRRKRNLLKKHFWYDQKLQQPLIKSGGSNEDLADPNRPAYASHSMLGKEDKICRLSVI